MPTVAYFRERASGGSPRSFLTLAGAAAETVDMGSAPTGVVVILESVGAVDDFNGCRIGGTAGTFDGTGYASGTLTLTDTGVSGSGLRVYKYFGAGIPTGLQPVHYSKTSENGFVTCTVVVFDSETDIGAPTIANGGTGGSPTAFAVTLTGTTSGRKVFAAGKLDAGSGNGMTPTGGTDAALLDVNGTYGRGAVLTKTAAGTSTTLNAQTASASYWLALFEAIAAAPPAPVLTGNVVVDDAAPTGTLQSSPPSTLTGNITTDGAAPTGSISSGAAAGTVLLSGWDNLSGMPLPNQLVARITLQRLSDGLQVLNLPGLSTSSDPATPAISITNAALVPGTFYLAIANNADGTVLGVERVQAT